MKDTLEKTTETSNAAQMEALECAGKYAASLGMASQERIRESIDNSPRMMAQGRFLARIQPNIRKSVPEAGGEAPVQRKTWSRGKVDGKQTDVTWTTSDVGGSTVGVKMVADPLGPEHLQGGPPKTGAQYPLMSQLPTDPSLDGSSKYIRGHLLNDNLGGPGEAENLFPLTGYANHEHERVIESQVKEWVNVRKQWARYEVNVTPAKIDLPNKTVNATFNCTADLLDPAQGMKSVHRISAQIPSIYKNPLIADDKNASKAVGYPGAGLEASSYIPLESTSKNEKEYRFTDELFDLIQRFSTTYQMENIIKGFEKIAGIGEGLEKHFVIFAIDALANGNQPQALTTSQKAQLSKLNAKTAEIVSNFHKYMMAEFVSDLQKQQ